MFLLFALFVGALTASLPLIMATASHATGRKLGRSYTWLPAVAALLFFASYFIPDVHISSETDTFQQHFVGGGLYAACLFIYFQKLLRWNTALFSGLIQLFAWVSALGVANELFEFVLVKLSITNIDIHDTSWDLLANTSGAFAGYIAYLLIKRLVKIPTDRQSN